MGRKKHKKPQKELTEKQKRQKRQLQVIEQKSIKAKIRDNERDLLTMIVNAANYHNLSAHQVPTAPAGIFIDVSPWDVWVLFETSTVSCTEANFKTHLREAKRATEEGRTWALPAVGKGRKQGSTNVVKASPEERKEAARLSTKKHSANQQRIKVDAKDARANHRDYVFPPYTMKLNCNTLAKDTIIFQTIADMFDNDNRTDIMEPDLRLDSDGVHDLKEKGKTTGQKRRIFFVSDTQRKHEHLSRDRSASNCLEVGPEFWRDRVAGKQLILDMGKFVLQHLTVVHSAKLKNGFTIKNLEFEAIMTPPGAKQQDPHKDSEENIVTAFYYAGVHKAGSCNSTLVAKQDTNFDTQCEDPIEYHRLPILLDADNIAQEVCVNHAAWPHKGPGNPSKTEPRYGLFFSYSLTSAAQRHTTGETVLREFRVRK